MFKAELLFLSKVFQSSPSPKTGRYANQKRLDAIAYKVPILTQSENWALCNSLGLIADDFEGSNPHPVRKLGAIT